MDELMKVWQVWNKNQNVGWNVTHTKFKVMNRVKNNLIQNVCAGMSVSLGLETAQNDNKKIQAMSNVFIMEHCGSSLLTSNRKTEFVKKLMISK
jgi:hypothetical protein